jgi:hypothetical protein
VTHDRVVLAYYPFPTDLHSVTHLGEHTVPKGALIRELWTFILMDYGGLRVYLEEKISEVRPSPRHGWVRKSDSTYHRTNKRDTAVQKEPEVPDMFKNLVLDYFRNQIRFEKWQGR